MYAVGARSDAGVVNLSVGVAVGVSAQPATDAQALGGSAGSGANGAFANSTVLLGVAAATVLRMRYLYTVVSTISYDRRRFRVRPRRVG